MAVLVGVRRSQAVDLEITVAWTSLPQWFLLDQFKSLAPFSSLLASLCATGQLARQSCRSIFDRAHADTYIEKCSCRVYAGRSDDMALVRAHRMRLLA